MIDILYKEAYTETHIKGKVLTVYEGVDSRNQHLASNILLNTSVGNTQKITDIHNWKKEGLLLSFKHFAGKISTAESGESAIENGDFLNPKFKTVLYLNIRRMMMQFYSANGTIEKKVTFTSFNYLTPAPDSLVVITIPKKSWFNINFQFAGIFKDVPNPASAKLYVAWKLEEQMQKKRYN
ncbi:hypothetical protein BB561_004034 [Smittium simulii]|uniref:Uncharacterized protein n=1 Tax=Smittium simulii TaxID=133385 RepID=A0A2T9YIE9_9FUNG|nr:hypothetical protein BB561_004034 [Smittium simulii]